MNDIFLILIFLLKSGRFSKIDNEKIVAVKNDDTKMIDALLTNDKKSTNGHGSTSNIPSAAGGLPGVRSRTRQSAGTDRTMTGSPNPNGRKDTDTEEDDNNSFELLIKTTLAGPKGQPPKKRTKKYGERKSCKLN